jgi:hypothetical protein
MQQILTELSALSAPTLTFLGTLVAAFAAILAAVITAIVGKLIVTPFLSARDRQDREVEWRKHAIELTKLDLDRRLKTRDPSDKRPIRPSILDFLANYRDLQELGKKSPRDLYEVIRTKRISVQAAPADTSLPNSSATPTALSRPASGSS